MAAEPLLLSHPCPSRWCLKKVTFLLILGLGFSLLPSLLWAESGIQAYQKGDFKTAHQTFFQQAAGGNAEAMVKVGVLHFFGQGVPQSYRQAEFWFEAALQRGNKAAQPLLAITKKRRAAFEMATNERSMEKALARITPPPIGHGNQTAMLSVASTIPVEPAPMVLFLLCLGQLVIILAMRQIDKRISRRIQNRFPDFSSPPWPETFIVVCIQLAFIAAFFVAWIFIPQTFFLFTVGSLLLFFLIVKRKNEAMGLLGIPRYQTFLEASRDRLFESVMGLTGQQFRNELVAKLAAILKSFLNPEQIFLFQILRQGEEIFVVDVITSMNQKILPKGVEGMEPMIFNNSKQLTEIKTIEGKKRFLFPIGLEKINIFILVLDFPLHSNPSPAMAEPFLKIFFYIEDLIRTRDQNHLTHLYNRRAFARVLDMLLKSLSGDSEQTIRLPDFNLALAMFKIDNFSAINDKIGYARGGQTIQAFANCLKDYFSSGEFLFHFGGNAFYALFFGSDRKHTDQRLAGFQEKLKNYPMPEKIQGISAFMTIQIGDTPEFLLEGLNQSMNIVNRQDEQGRANTRCGDDLVRKPPEAKKEGEF